MIRHPFGRSPVGGGRRERSDGSFTASCKFRHSAAISLHESAIPTPAARLCFGTPTEGSCPHRRCWWSILAESNCRGCLCCCKSRLSRRLTGSTDHFGRNTSDASRTRFLSHLRGPQWSDSPMNVVLETAQREIEPALPSGDSRWRVWRLNRFAILQVVAEVVRRSLGVTSRLLPASIRSQDSLNREQSGARLHQPGVERERVRSRSCAGR